MVAAKSPGTSGLYPECFGSTPNATVTIQISHTDAV